jgi:pSer/pThr/pTyr-binding forkhead associated (FHA) protein
LRFETGERRGETIPISGTGLTVGRKPGNTLQILDNSVSGKHAELLVDDEGVLLRDLGSTNGTRVGAERVIEKRLEANDVVLFGNIRLAFVDNEVSSEPVLEENAPCAASARTCWPRPRSARSRAGSR